MSKKRAKSNKFSTSILEAVGHELKVNPPKILAHTREKFGAKRAEDQRVAILLNKSRKLGVKIKKKGRKIKR